MKENQESKVENPGQRPAEAPTLGMTAGSRPFASSPLIVTLLIVLLAAVCVQGIMMASLISKSRSAQSPAKHDDKGLAQESPELVARPATPNSATGSNAAPSSPLASRPLGSLLTDDFFGDDWQPFAEMARMRKEMDQLFEDSFQRFRDVPGFNQDWLKPNGGPSISDEGDHLVVTLDIPGADESTLDIKLEDGVLSISGKREEVDEQRDQGGNVIRRSQSSSQFQRSLSLPGQLDVAGLQSSYQDGTLTVRIPKAKAAASA